MHLTDTQRNQRVVRRALYVSHWDTSAHLEPLSGLPDIFSLLPSFSSLSWDSLSSWPFGLLCPPSRAPRKAAPFTPIGSWRELSQIPSGKGALGPSVKHQKLSKFCSANAISPLTAPLPLTTAFGNVCLFSLSYQKHFPQMKGGKKKTIREGPVLRNSLRTLPQGRPLGDISWRIPGSPPSHPPQKQYAVLCLEHHLQTVKPCYTAIRHHFLKPYSKKLFPYIVNRQ